MLTDVLCVKEEERLKLVARNDAESGTFCRAQLALLTDRLEERVRSGALATVSAVVDAWQELVAVYLKLAKGKRAAVCCARVVLC